MNKKKKIRIGLVVLFLPLILSFACFIQILPGIIVMLGALMCIIWNTVKYFTYDLTDSEKKDCINYIISASIAGLLFGFYFTTGGVINFIKGE